MIGRGLDGSAIKYVQALSPGDFNAAGSTTPLDLSAFQHGTLLVSAGSVATGFEAHVQRSSTSNGTFDPFGASIALSTGSHMAVRSFGINTSQVWHRVFYDNGTGSAVASINLVLQGARFVPIEQNNGPATCVLGSIA